MIEEGHLGGVGELHDYVLVILSLLNWMMVCLAFVFIILNLEVIHCIYLCT